MTRFILILVLQKKLKELEQKYMSALQQHSERLRLAAALQADLVSRKVGQSFSYITR